MHIDCFILEKGVLRFCWIGGRTGPAAGWDAVERQMFPFAGVESGFRTLCSSYRSVSTE
jgi:hypothetical protein